MLIKRVDAQHVAKFPSSFTLNYCLYKYKKCCPANVWVYSDFAVENMWILKDVCLRDFEISYFSHEQISN